MERRRRLERLRRPAGLRGLVLLLVTVGFTATASRSPASGDREALAEEVYENIRVLRGIPASRILPTMELISASLGVSCGHCHVRGAFESDDEPPKGVARGMIRMTRAINGEYLGERGFVTCNSCHRGELRPAAEPLPSGTGIGGDGSGDPGSAGDSLEDTLEPSDLEAGEVIARHVAAVGGAEAVRGIESRVSRGSVVLAGGRELPVEIVQESPFRRSVVLEMAHGENRRVYDGTGGIVAVAGRPPRAMSGSEVALEILANDFDWLARPEEVLAQARVLGTGAIHDREVLVLEGRVEDHPVLLLFGAEDGLLRRIATWEETPLGRLQRRIDLLEYRDVEGLRTPVRWTRAEPRGHHTVRIDEVDHGAEIPDDRFAVSPNGTLHANAE